MPLFSLAACGHKAKDLPPSVWRYAVAIRGEPAEGTSGKEWICSGAYGVAYIPRSYRRARGVRGGGEAGGGGSKQRVERSRRSAGESKPQNVVQIQNVDVLGALTHWGHMSKRGCYDLAIAHFLLDRFLLSYAFEEGCFKPQPKIPFQNTQTQALLCPNKPLTEKRLVKSHAGKGSHEHQAFEFWFELRWCCSCAAAVLQAAAAEGGGGVGQGCAPWVPSPPLVNAAGTTACCALGVGFFECRGD